MAQQLVAQALFDWINSLNIVEPVRTPDDLNTGTVLWTVLQHIDGIRFAGSLPIETEARDWDTRWTNLKHIYQALTAFLVEECDQILPLPGGSPDLKSIAKESTMHDLTQLLKLVFVAAAKCENRNSFLQDVKESQHLDLGTLASIILEAGSPAGEDVSHGVLENEEPTTSSPSKVRANKGAAAPTMDIELAFEERLGKMITEKEHILQAMQDLQDELDALKDEHLEVQRNNAIVQNELNSTKERLTDVLSGRSQSEASRGLDSKHLAIIEALESQVAANDGELESLKRSNEVLKVKAAMTQRLQDEYDELKIENSKLARRANIADKYKQKLEANQSFEKENQDLKARLASLQAQLRDSDSRDLSTADLRRENEEYRRVLPGIEQERHELNEMKRRIESEYHILEARWQDAQERSAKQQATIDELQGRLEEYLQGDTPTTPKASRPNAGPLADLERSSTDAEPKLGEAFASLDLEGQDWISEPEFQALMSAMRAQIGGAGSAAKASGIELEKKFAATIEKGRSITQALIQVFEFLSEPRVEFQEVKDLDSTRPHKNVDCGPDKTGIPSSTSSSVISLAPTPKHSVTRSPVVSRSSSILSVHSFKAMTTSQKSSKIKFASIWHGR